MFDLLISPPCIIMNYKEDEAFISILRSHFEKETTSSSKEEETNINVLFDQVNSLLNDYSNLEAVQEFFKSFKLPIMVNSREVRTFSMHLENLIQFIIENVVDTTEQSTKLLNELILVNKELISVIRIIHTILEKQPNTGLLNNINTYVSSLEFTINIYTFSFIRTDNIFFAHPKTMFKIYKYIF